MRVLSRLHRGPRHDDATDTVGKQRASIDPRDVDRRRELERRLNHDPDFLRELEGADGGSSEP